MGKMYSEALNLITLRVNGCIRALKRVTDEGARQYWTTELKKAQYHYNKVNKKSLMDQLDLIGD